MKDRCTFDHENLDVYKLELTFIMLTKLVERFDEGSDRIHEGPDVDDA